MKTQKIVNEEQWDCAEHYQEVRDFEGLLVGELSENKCLN